MIVISKCIAAVKYVYYSSFSVKKGTHELIY